MRLMMMLLWGCTGPETNVKAGVPELVLDITEIDFGEVVLGRQATVELAILNDGIGDLVIDEVSLDSLSSPEFSVTSDLPITIERGEYGGPRLRYVPTEVGQDFGRVTIVSNDPDQPELDLDLAAFGVEPLIDVDPSTLWYGTVEKGEERSLTFSIAARGTGTLSLQDMRFSHGADELFTLTMPSGVELPYKMSTGLSADFVVTYAAGSADSYEETLYIESNDPTTPSFEISLLVNTPDDPNKNTPPVVEITDPNYGEYYLVGESMPVVATVYDTRDAADQLYCYLLLGSTPTGTGGTPDSKGRLSVSESNLTDGDTTLTVRCLDTDGAVGEDTVDVSIFDPEEPLLYTISGGATLFDYWSVDDDITVYVNGTVVFEDSNRGADTHPPLQFEAAYGDAIRIVASDVNYCQRSLDPLTLHFGTNHSQDLNGEVCQSACPEDPCYDSALDWAAGSFYDEYFTVQIP